MRVLVTGSAGHLGEAVVRALSAAGLDVIGLDRLASPFTREVASVTDRPAMRRCMRGMNAVVHAAALHKPHIATHDEHRFVEVNIVGTLNLLQEAVAAGVGSFVFTSTTSVFGDALRPCRNAPAVRVTEDLIPVPRNIYGVTKGAAESLCELFHREHGLACLVLRTARFFPEEDDSPAMRESYDDLNLKVNEFLHRRVDLEDAARAHWLAIERAPVLGFGRYVISATTPFTRDDLGSLRIDAPSVVKSHFPGFEGEYDRLGWKMYDSIDRVYVNSRAREELGWRPRYDFGVVLGQLRAGRAPGSALAAAIGSKGYHVGY